MYSLYICKVKNGGFEQKFWKGGILTNPKKCCIIDLSVKNGASGSHRKADKNHERRKGVKKKPRIKYTPELAGQMYRFFLGYEDRGAPSFQKFARSAGLTTEDLESFRSRKRFDRAYRECQQIRRDYLIDRALDKRFDGSFTKYLLSLDDGEMENESELLLRLEVKD